MAKEYEIQTMKKDINRLLKKKAVISEPISTQQSRAVLRARPVEASTKQVSGPPEKLPVLPKTDQSRTERLVPPSASSFKKLPGTPLPSEPIISTTSPGPVELPRPSEPMIPLFSSRAEKPPRPKKVSTPIILVIIVLLVGIGFYYWWNYMRVPEPAGFLEIDEFEIIGSLDMNIPVEISRALGGKYTFFVYKQENRAGFIAKITERETLETGLRDWENTMPKDLRPLFLGQEPGEAVAEEFQDSAYKGVNVRYLNFTNSTLALDYAIVGDYLVITTSKESMFRVLDKIF